MHLNFKNILVAIVLLSFFSCEKAIMPSDIYGQWSGTYTIEQVFSHGGTSYEGTHLAIDFKEDGTAVGTAFDEDIYYYWELVNDKIYIIDTAVGQYDMIFGSGTISFEVLENTPNRQYWQEKITNDYYEKWTEWDLSKD